MNTFGGRQTRPFQARTTPPVASPVTGEVPGSSRPISPPAGPLHSSRRRMTIPTIGDRDPDSA